MLGVKYLVSIVLSLQNVPLIKFCWIFSRSPAAKLAGAEEGVFTDHPHMQHDSLTS